jgi:Na+(H+)/acetate symporter ActP
MIPLLFVIAVTIATIALGIAATRKSKTAADFFVAGRSVSVFWNASAISGEYLSAASFMGVAGLIMKNGYDALWYPVGYATGYLFLLLFIAGPLRRFGAYTIPDFAQGRFDSPTFRKIAVIFVLCIGFFYTMPQMKGAGVTMMSILNWPYWVGILIVGSVITFNVAMGGMRGITLVQAFQYWVKVFAIAAPLFILINVFGGYGEAVGKSTVDPALGPRLGLQTEVKVKGADAKPNNVMTFSNRETTILTFPKGAVISKVSPARKLEPREDAIPVERMVKMAAAFNAPALPIGPDGQITIPAGGVLQIPPVQVSSFGLPRSVGSEFIRTSAKLEFAEPTTVIVSRGILHGGIGNPLDGPVAPNAPTNDKWVNPFGPMSGKHGYPLLYTYSLIIALVCGTAGLPHILVRFYTNPDGRAARRTTLWVMVMLGGFYVFTPMWGALGRAFMPQLYASNGTDTVVIKLPTMLQSEVLGQILSGIASAGAFAAFMSTFSGLLVSMSGAFAHDIYGRILRPESSPESRLKAFKVAAFGVGAVSMLLGLLVESFDIAMMVGWAFAIGAASYFPLLLLGSWWRGLTKVGAAAGMLIGGLLSLGAIVGSMLLDKGVLKLEVSPLTRSLMEQPAIWGVPLSLGLMIAVSLATKKTIPADVDLKMLRLHAPEELGISKNYVD